MWEFPSLIFLLVFLILILLRITGSWALSGCWMASLFSRYQRRRTSSISLLFKDWDYNSIFLFSDEMEFHSKSSAMSVVSCRLSVFTVCLQFSANAMWVCRVVCLLKLPVDGMFSSFLFFVCRTCAVRVLFSIPFILTLKSYQFLHFRLSNAFFSIRKKLFTFLSFYAQINCFYFLGKMHFS